MARGQEVNAEGGGVFNNSTVHVVMSHPTSIGRHAFVGRGGRRGTRDGVMVLLVCLFLLSLEIGAFGALQPRAHGARAATTGEGREARLPRKIPGGCSAPGASPARPPRAFAASRSSRSTIHRTGRILARVLPRADRRAGERRAGASAIARRDRAARSRAAREFVAANAIQPHPTPRVRSSLTVDLPPPRALSPPPRLRISQPRRLFRRGGAEAPRLGLLRRSHRRRRGARRRPRR